MMIKLHGGDCCGVKHIHGLTWYPDMMLAARPAKPKGETSFRANHGASHDMRHYNLNQDKDFFNEKAPKETYARRLSRMIRFIKKYREHGLIEIVLGGSYQMKAWHTRLLRRGFKQVSQCKNSNTGSMLYIYHLAY